MDDLSIEMQMFFEQISREELKRLAIDLIKQLAEFDPTEMIINSSEIIASRLGHEDDLVEYLKSETKQ
ncbi:hypothetical protein JR338_10670 [Chloroflexota bacterium]|nr:hypothetical protein JR338_10670 [Chloroflexota bacterium]